MFSCKKREPRKNAVNAIQRSEILSHFPPGIALGHWDYPPHIKSPQLLGSSSGSRDITELQLLESSETFHNWREVDETEFHYPRKHTSIMEEPQYLDPARRIDWNNRVQYILNIGFDRTLKVGTMKVNLEPGFHTTTIGAVFKSYESWFLFAPAHVFPKPKFLQNMGPEDPSESDSDCEFGGFDEGDEGSDGDIENDLFSQYSASSPSSDIEHELDLDCEDISSAVSPEGSQSAEPSSRVTAETDLTMELFHNSEEEDASGKFENVQLEINSSFFSSAGLDYCLVGVVYNQSFEHLPILSRENVIRIEDGNVDIIAVTGAGNRLEGKLSGRHSYVRFSDVGEYQEVFTAKFNGSLLPGASGSIVRDATTGKIYGHIIAGSMASQIAYIVPALNVLNEIERHFVVKKWD